MARNIHEFRESLRGNPLLKILLIGFLILLLQIPVSMVKNVIRERAVTKDKAVAEVTSKWGASQKIIGPMITVPYKIRYLAHQKDDEKVFKDAVKLAAFFPEDLDITANVESQVLHRGIYEVPVYAADLVIRGQFSQPDFAELGIDPEEIAWDKARLVITLPDVRAVQNQTRVVWNGENLPFLPGAGELVNQASLGDIREGIHVPLKGHLTKSSYTFAIGLNIRGNDFLGFSPLGRNTRLKIRSGWPHPSFQGNWLPESREIGEDGFGASWNISYLGRNFPQSLDHLGDYVNQVRGAVFGVSLIKPVDPYRMSLRSAKYAILFLVLTFVSFWLFELTTGLRVHAIQYIFIGFALCLFYLLNLSLAEHIGFLMAYLAATLAVIVMTSAYSLVVLKTGKRAAVIAGVIAALYTFLYILLQEQDYALLVGSIALFLVLGVIMFITRNIDWYNFGQAAEEEKESLCDAEK